MKHRMFRLPTLLVYALMLIVFSPNTALGLSLYDDFPGSTIDASKWQNLEIVREIRSGKLVSILRATGPPGDYSNTSLLTNPTTIQSLQADVRLNAYTAPPGGTVRARVVGYFYNDGTAGSSSTGDVAAQVYLLGTSSGVEIRYSAFKCTNADCSTSTDVVPSTLVKAAGLGETHTLGVAWDGSVLTFTVDGAATVVDPRPVAPVAGAPRTLEKKVGTRISIARAGGEGYVAGDFDNVYVNGVLYDNFDGPPYSGPHLDPARWASLEMVQEIADGRLVSKIGYAGVAYTWRANFERFVNQNAVTALRTDVTVTALQSNNSSAKVQIGGSFYNDGASTGVDDPTGDISGGFHVYSTNGGPLTVSFIAARQPSAQSSQLSILFSDSLGTVDIGETHTLLLVWDGSVFTYGMDGTTRTYDPKPIHPIVKPPILHFNEIRTIASTYSAGSHSYIAATFDNVYVNSEALALPKLAPFLQQTVAGDVVTAGVGLRGTGTGTINLAGIPPGTTVEKAYLYWATLGKDGTFTTPTLNSTPVSGARIGQSDDPFWGASQSFAYRADVTPLVTGNGGYTVAGLPHAGPAINDSEGASLVVIYSLPGAPPRIITINDGAVTLGAVTLGGSRAQLHSTPLSGFVAASPPTGAKLTFLVGDGQSATPEYAGINATLLATDEFSGSDGSYWDTLTYDVSAAIPAGATSANAVLSTSNDSLVWVAAILSVPIDTSAPSLTLSLNQSSFHAGQQLTLKATATPGTTPVLADVYIALQLPDGSLLFLRGDGSFSTDLQPIVAHWLVGPYSGQIFSYTCTGWEPAGSYTWLAAFTQPGTLNFIGPIVSAPFRIDP